MNLVTKNIDDLKGATYNPRKELKPGDKEYEKLKRSVESFGYVDPIIWNKRTDTVVGGHQRLIVMRDLGYTSVEVVEVDLDETNEKALNIALNKVSGEWDAEKLEDLLRELDVETDFDITLTGFDLDELETLYSGAIDGIDDDPEDDEETKDAKSVLDEFCKEANEAIKNPRDIKLGDRWQLGNHVLLCGDSFKEETFKELLDGETCSMVFTDPPYEYESYKNINVDIMYKGLDGKNGSFNGYSADAAFKKAKEKGLCEFNIEKIEYLFKSKIQNI